MFLEFTMSTFILVLLCAPGLPVCLESLRGPWRMLQHHRLSPGTLVHLELGLSMPSVFYVTTIVLINLVSLFLWSLCFVLSLGCHVYVCVVFDPFQLHLSSSKHLMLMPYIDCSVYKVWLTAVLMFCWEWRHSVTGETDKCFSSKYVTPAPLLPVQRELEHYIVRGCFLGSSQCVTVKCIHAYVILRSNEHIWKEINDEVREVRGGNDWSQVKAW